MAITIDEMASFCKRKGFIFPNSEIYGGMAGFFDYGPYGVEIKNSIRQDFWKRFVQSREDVVGIEGTIITHPDVWKASGHVNCFQDILIECKKCHERFRADHLIEEALKIQADGLKEDAINDLVNENKIKCPKCKGELDKASGFGLMFTTNVGPKKGEESIAYLRPETAQLIFANFKLVHDVSRVKLPFGIAQTGKAFRNEISPRNFLFRTREFEQMEIEFFIKPDDSKCPLLKEKDLKFKFQILTEENQEKKQGHAIMSIREMLDKKILGEWHAYWLKEVFDWFTAMGIKESNLRLRQHRKDELAHYSSACFDIEYKFPFGWKEIHGNADRGQYDLLQHEKASGKPQAIFDEESKQKIIPRVIEPSQGLDRAFLAVLFDAYEFDKERDYVVLHLSPKLAPIKCGIFPLVNKEGIPELAMKVYDELKGEFPCQFDKSGAVGRRYARQDELGTPFCITVDFDSLKNKDVTIRERDSTEQKRVKISELKNVLSDLVSGVRRFEDI